MHFQARGVLTRAGPSMMKRIAALVLGSLAGSAVSLAQESSSPPLVPAGSINAALAHPARTILAEDDPDVLEHAEWVNREFFGGKAPILRGEETVIADLQGRNLVVFGTVEGHPWLQKYRERLPFRYGEGTVELEGTHRGDRLRVISSLRNPVDPERRAVLYTALRTADIRGINAVFHGPTEFVVANGDEPLASGNYRARGDVDPEAMEEDFQYLVEKLLAVHPATVEQAPDELAAAIDAAWLELDEPMPRARFWFLLNSVLVALGDSHTRMGRLGSGQELELPLVWLADGPAVAADTELLRRGDRLLSLADDDPADLLSKMRTLVAAENEAFLRNAAGELLADLAVLQTLGIAREAPVAVRIQRGEEQIDLRIGLGTARRPEPSADWVRWEFHDEEDLAVFVLDRCVVDEHYLERLRQFFEEVAARSIQRIAIDLRRNSGGQSNVCDEFLRYVDVPEYRYYSAAIRETADSLAQRGYEREIGYHEYGPQVVVNDRHDGVELFRGELFALTSNRTFSSGSWFAVVLSDNGLGEVVGETAGGAPSSYGDILTFSLPRSAFSFTVSFKKWLRPDTAREPHGELVPDHAVPFTSEHLRTGRDPAIEFLLELGG